MKNFLGGVRGRRKIFLLLPFCASLLLLAILIISRNQPGVRRPTPAEPNAGTALLAFKGLLLDEGLTRQDATLASSPDGPVLNCVVDPAFSVDTFKEKIRNLAPQVGYTLAEESRTGRGEAEVLTLRLVPAGGAPGDEAISLIFGRRRPDTRGRDSNRRRPPQAAIVIDDLGQARDVAERTVMLPLPVTLSIMPRQAASEEAARLAARHGKEVLLHLPMEPLDYPGNDPGEGALMAGMTPEEMAGILREDLLSVPGAVGINNHMGSRLTADEQAMSLLMRLMARSGLLFLDSLTSPDSVAYLKARGAGLRTARRDIFLDNVDEPDYIRAQIGKLIGISLQEGKAVGIGHPRENTLAALEESLGRFREAGVEIVPLSRLSR